MPNISLVLGLVVHLISHSPQIAELDYAVHPVPQADRTRLEVALSFKANPSERLEVELPRDIFGTPSLYQSVEAFEGIGDTKVEAGKAANARSVTAGPDGKVSLRYALSFDPAKMEDGTYSPNTSANHFHVAGSQWMLRIGNLQEVRQHEVRIQDAPKGWRFYSSLGPDATKLSFKRSYSYLGSSTLGGVSRNFYEFRIRDKKVSVSIPHPLQIPNEKVVESVRKIVDLQRTWFADDSDEYFHVAVNPKEGNIAGMCVRRFFTCFLDHDITLDQLNVLLAHEMFHNWMGNQIDVGVPANEFQGKYQWFKEGVNEFFARKLLLDAGLISKDLYAQLFNADLLNIRDNPNSAATFADLTSADEKGSYDITFIKLDYYRGALIGLLLDAEQRAKGKAEPSALLKELLKLSKSGTEMIPEAKFYEVADKMEIGVRAAFERYMRRGEPIQPGADWLGPEFTVAQVGIPSYTLGFDLNASRAAGEIKGVQEGSNAYKAGLRNGMKYVSTGNSNRWSNAWDKTKPFRVTVKDEGKERTIEFFPHGPVVKTPQFVRKPAG